MKIAKYQPTLSLKPTQFALGVLEIEYKVKKMLTMNKRRLKKEIDNHVIPIVISPWGELCVVDHHHFLFAAWHAHVKKVKVEVVKDFSNSKLTYRQFWKKMVKLNFAHLMDQFGTGPQDPLYLPDDIRGMADDPYRTIAWIVRKEGGYLKTNAKFSEFIWADFFRKHGLLVKHGRKGLKDVVGKAVMLAKSPAAKNLPGHISEKKVEAEMHAAMSKTEYITKAEKKGPLATAPNITAK